MSASSRPVCVVYEHEQIPMLEAFLETGAAAVVALTPFVEDALQERGIEFSSGRGLGPSSMSRFVDAQAWVDWMCGDALRWFSYREVSLAGVLRFSAQFYIVQLLYYAHVFKSIAAQHAGARIIVFASTQTVPERSRPLAREQIRAIADSAELVGKAKSIELVVHGAERAASVSVPGVLGRAKQAAVECALALLNICMGLRRGRSPRVLASDYWRHIEPVMEALGGELILFDRSEALNAGLRNMWRYRMRLYNFGAYPAKERSDARAEALAAFVREWDELRARGIEERALGDVSIRPLLQSMLESFVSTEATRLMQDIDSCYAMLKDLRPDAVFLRVSVTSQPHFQILAAVSRSLGIPSLELQHGLEHLGQGSISARHGAEYVAVYGQVIQDEFAALGRPRDKTPIVGSPRFDAYHEAARAFTHRSGAGLVVLCLAYGTGVEWFYDDYEIEDYYRALADALKRIPGSSALIKLRPGSFREADSRASVERAFAGVSYRIVQYEALPELFAQSDAVYSYYSTVILEAMQFGMPVVAYSAQEMEREQIRNHLTRYADRGALAIATTPGEVSQALAALADAGERERLSLSAQAALAAFHSFDGKASERIAALIRKLARG